MSEYEISNLKYEVWTAARDGQTNRLKTLLENVRKELADEILNNHTDEDGQSTTPLIIAVIKGNEEVVSTLNDFGVDLEQKGLTVCEGETFHGATALWCASCWGHYNIVRILVDNGADVDNPTETGSTPLRPATYSDRFDIIKYLVEHGANVNRTNNYKNTCFINTCFTGNIEIAKYLLQKGCDPGIKNVNGKTALHFSAENGNLALSKLLVDIGVSFTVKDNFGTTPLMKAAINGTTDMVDYLSTLAECSRETHINALELLGTSYLFQKDTDILKAHDHFMTAMQERYKDTNDVIPKRVPPMSSIQSITGTKECKTLSELIDLRDNKLSLCIEAIHIYERVLGTENPEATFPLLYTGAVFADYGDFNKCIDLWHFYSTVCQNIDEGCDVYRFPIIFADMLNGGIQINFSSLLNCFQSAEAELRLDKGRMQKHVRKYRQNYEKDILTCTYLVGIMLLSYSSKNEKCQLNRAVYNFIHQNPRLLNGFTPLHMCCDCDSNGNDIDVKGEILFPNVIICKAFVACGANVNAQDNNRNTPLHIIAKCVDVEFDTLREIIKCLIDNGVHVDASNINGKTAADIASSDIAKSIIKAHGKVSLKCLSAKTVKRHKIEYQGVIPKSLHKFVELH